MVWSVSQRRAGRVHQGKTQVWSRTAVISACRSGTTSVSTGSWASRSSTGFTVILPAVCAPVADLAGGDQLVAVLQPRRARRLRGRPGRGGRRGRPAASDVVVSRRARSALLNHLDSQVEGELVAGELADRGRTADVEGVFRAQLLQLGGEAGDGLFEVQGVGQVELAVHRRGAGVGDLLLLDGEVPAVGLRQPAFLGEVGHVRRDRLLHQAFELDGADLVRHVSHVPVHERRRLRGQQQGLVGDPARQPRPQVTLDHAAPHPREPVGAARGRAPTYRFPASVETPIAAANSVIANSATNGAPSPATGIPVSPYRSPIVAASSIESVECIAAQATAACSRLASARSAIAADPHARKPAPHPRCRARGVPCCHGSTQAPTTDTRSPKTPCFTGMWTTIWRNLSTATTRGDPGDRDCESSRKWPPGTPRRATT